MSRGRSGGSGVANVLTIQTLLKYIKDLFDSFEAIYPDMQRRNPEKALDFKAALAQLSPLVATFSDVSEALDVAVAAEADYEANYGSKVREAEQRLVEIDTTVRALSERLAVLLQEQDRIDAEVLTKWRELAEVNAALEKYRAQIAAM